MNEFDQTYDASKLPGDTPLALIEALHEYASGELISLDPVFGMALATLLDMIERPLP